MKPFSGCFLGFQFNSAYHLNYQSQDKKGKFEERSIGFEGAQSALRGAQTTLRAAQSALRGVQTTLRSAKTALRGAQTKKKGSAVFLVTQVVCHHFNVYRCKMNSCLNLIVEVCQILREFCKFAFSAVYLPSGFNSAPVFVPFLHSKAVISVQF